MNTKSLQKPEMVLERKLHELRGKRADIARRVEALPDGKLRITHVRGNTAYYLVKDRQERYLRKESEALIKDLAEKSYLEKLIKELDQQIKIISNFIADYSATALSDIFGNLSPDRKKLIDPIFLTNEEYALQWQQQSYTPKGFAPNDPEFYTEKGERVRSKSEKIIADKLYHMGIPYRYECPLFLKGYGIVYPDFTTLNVQTREEFYWEHCGMMDSENYVETTLRKIEEYEKSQILPGVKLILTHETSKRPLNMKVVEMYIQNYLL